MFGLAGTDTLAGGTGGDDLFGGPGNDLLNGGDGQYSIRLKDNTKAYDTSYPGVELLPDGTFVTTTYGHWTKGQQPYVLSVRFKLQELDAKARGAHQ